jgi:hypothetical protein
MREHILIKGHILRYEMVAFHTRSFHFILYYVISYHFTKYHIIDATCSDGHDGHEPH